MTPPRRPIDRSHIHRAEDIYAPGEGDVESIGEIGLGGEQVMRLIGPFEIGFDTPNLVNPDDYGYALGPIPKDAIVTNVWVTPDDGSGGVWTGAGTGAYLMLGVGTTTDGVDDIVIFSLTSNNGGYAFDEQWPLARVEPRAAWDDGLSLVAQVYANGGGLNQGRATVHALIALST